MLLFPIRVLKMWLDPLPMRYAVAATAVTSSGSAGQAMATAQAALPMPELDISGVWQTSANGTSPDLFIRTNPAGGTGYAVWLSNPPQSLRVRNELSLGSGISGAGSSNTWLFTDIAGTVFRAVASSNSTNATSGSASTNSTMVEGPPTDLAMLLTVGSGSTAAVWTRRTANDLVRRRYTPQAGETLGDVGGRFGTSAAEILALNPFLSSVLAAASGVDPSTLQLPPVPLLLPGSSLEGPASECTNWKRLVLT
jgi:hypothetical protein